MKNRFDKKEMMKRRSMSIWIAVMMVLFLCSLAKSVKADELWKNCQQVQLNHYYYVQLNSKSPYQVFSIKPDTTNVYYFFRGANDSQGYLELELYNQAGDFLTSTENIRTMGITKSASINYPLTAGNTYYLVAVYADPYNMCLDTYGNIEVELYNQYYNASDYLEGKITKMQDPELICYLTQDIYGNLITAYDYENNFMKEDGNSFEVFSQNGKTIKYYTSRKGLIKEGEEDNQFYYIINETESIYYGLIYPNEKHILLSTHLTGCTARLNYKVDFRQYKRKVKDFQYIPNDPNFKITQTDSRSGYVAVTPAKIIVQYTDGTTETFQNTRYNSKTGATSYSSALFYSDSNEGSRITLEFGYNEDFSKVGKVKASLGVIDCIKEVEFEVEKREDDIVDVSYDLGYIPSFYSENINGIYSSLYDQLEDGLATIEIVKKDGTIKQYIGSSGGDFRDSDGNSLDGYVDVYSDQHKQSIQPGLNLYQVYVNGHACDLPIFRKVVTNMTFEPAGELEIPENAFLEDVLKKYLAGTLTVEYNDGSVEIFSGTSILNAETNDGIKITYRFDSIECNRANLAVLGVNQECFIDLIIDGFCIPVKVKRIHDYNEVLGRNATCVNHGSTASRYCRFCGESEAAEIIPATGHVDENQDEVCDVCNEPFYFQIIQPTDINATCGEIVTLTTGVIEEEGSNQEYTYQWYLWDYGKKEVNYGDEATLTFPSSWINYSDVDYFSCVITRADGKQHETRKIAVKRQHVKGEIVNEEEATCTKSGSREYYCANCTDRSTNYETIPVSGHVFELSSSIIEPTCSKEGRREDISCVNCGYVLKRGEPIERLAHTYIKSPAVTATCTKEGRTEGVYCDVCGEIKEEATILPPLGHQKVKQNEKAATVNSEGYTGDVVCATCGQVLEKGTKTAKLSASNKAKKQTITVAKNLKKKYIVKSTKLKKTDLKIKILAKAKGKLSYKVTSYPKKAKKQISVSKKGEITLKKGAKKGTYKITVTAAATKDGTYAKTKKVLTIVVK